MGFPASKVLISDELNDGSVAEAEDANGALLEETKAYLAEIDTLKVEIDTLKVSPCGLKSQRERERD